MPAQKYSSSAAPFHLNTKIMIFELDRLFNKDNIQKD